MATQRKPSTKRGRRTKLNPVPRRDPSSGPPVYYPTERGTIPLSKIRAAIEAVWAEKARREPMKK